MLTIKLAHQTLFGGRLAFIPKLIAGIGGTGIGTRGEGLRLRMLSYMNGHEPASEVFKQYAYLNAVGSECKEKSNTKG